MRICGIADGRHVHAHRWLRYLAGCGHEIHLVSLAPLDDAQVSLVQSLGVTYHGSLGPFHLKRLWETTGTLRWLKGILREHKVELIDSHFLGSNAWYAALTGFRPLVLTVMGGDVCGPDWRPRGGRERLLTPLALSRADLVVCWSRPLGRVVSPFCRRETPLHAIHGGVDLHRFCTGRKPGYLLDRWGIPRDAQVVFSPRLMRPLYNLHRIAEASRAILERCPRAFFVYSAPEVATDTAYEHHVRELMQRNGTDRVRFTGGIAHEEMPDYYRLADVTVSIPSTDGTPMSVLESMACGTPVVVGAIPDFDPEYIEPERTVLAADPNDPPAIAAAITRVLSSPDLVASLTSEARRRVSATGSYEAQMSRLELLYQTVLSESRRTCERAAG